MGVRHQIAFVRLTQQAAELEQSAARLQPGSG